MGFIYLRNKGGLGNQLFIYNFGLLLSSKYNLKLIFDNSTGFLKDKYGRTPMLDKLLIENPVEATILQKLSFIIVKKMPVWIKKIIKIQYLLEDNFQKKIDLDDLNLNSSSRIFVEGYFQSFLYLKESAFAIQNNVFEKITFNLCYKNYYDRIISSNSICVHVRRNAYDNLLSKEYYEKAFIAIKKRIKNPSFFIFSDSLDWCETQFQENDVTFVANSNKPDDLQEFFLMKSCKHFIIANSTFSWWAAFLGRYDNKLVIAPSNNQLGIIETFYPNNWLKL